MTRRRPRSADTFQREVETFTDTIFLAFLARKPGRTHYIRIGLSSETDSTHKDTRSRRPVLFVSQMKQSVGGFLLYLDSASNSHRTAPLYHLLPHLRGEAAHRRPPFLERPAVHRPLQLRLV